jgi:hypothetical protein
MVVMGDHYVPRAYLRGFCAPGSERIYAYEKQTGRCFGTNVVNVAQERHFYPREVEQRLNLEVEVPANAVLRKIQQHATITVEEKFVLAVYAAVMIKRVPRHRARLADMIPTVMSETFDEFYQRMETARHQHPHYAANIERHVLQARRLQEEYTRALPPHLVTQFQEPWPTPNVLGAIAAMTWRFAISTGPSFFLTSDNPAFFFDCWGLASAQSELTFPLTSTIAVHASLQEGGDLTYVPMAQTLVKELNRRTALAATRFLFYHKQEAWLQALAEKPRTIAELSRIVWLSTPASRPRSIGKW